MEKVKYMQYCMEIILYIYGGIEYGSKYLATDADFSGSDDDEFLYTGNAKIVYIPHEIKGVPVTSYRNMFQGSSVEKVLSDNPNITTIAGMFKSTTANALDLTDLDTTNVTATHYMFADSKVSTVDISNLNMSKVTQYESMFVSSSIKTCYIRSKGDLSKLNDSTTNAPRTLQFVVKGEN